MTVSTTVRRLSSLDQVHVQREVDEAELATVAFLARDSGRTLEAYRQDLRRFFATSPIDRRPATVCGIYRFAHIDGRISSNPEALPLLLRTPGAPTRWAKYVPGP